RVLFRSKGARGDRLEPFPRNRGLGRAHGRHAGRRGPRHPAAGLSRGKLGRSGARDHRPDQGAARIRAERQGHHRGRPDAGRNHAGPVMRWLIPLILLPAAAQAESLVALRTLPAQTVVTEADVTLVEAQIDGALTAIAPALGLQVKTTVYAGRPLRPENLGAPA